MAFKLNKQFLSMHFFTCLLSYWLPCSMIKWFDSSFLNFFFSSVKFNSSCVWQRLDILEALEAAVGNRNGMTMVDPLFHVQRDFNE